jgi:hypothetical protein
MFEWVTMKTVALAQAATSAKASAPPAAVAMMALFGIPLNEWVLILSAIWFLLQIGLKIYVTFFVKHGRRKDDRET